MTKRVQTLQESLTFLKSYEVVVTALNYTGTAQTKMD